MSGAWHDACVTRHDVRPQLFARMHRSNPSSTSAARHGCHVCRPALSCARTRRRHHQQGSMAKIARHVLCTTRVYWLLVVHERPIAILVRSTVLRPWLLRHTRNVPAPRSLHPDGRTRCAAPRKQARPAGLEFGRFLSSERDICARRGRGEDKSTCRLVALGAYANTCSYM